MSWTSTYWEQDDNVYSGYPYSKISKPIDSINYDNLYIPLKQDNEEFNGYPYSYIPDIFTYSKTFQPFQQSSVYFYNFPYTILPNDFMFSKTFQWITQTIYNFDGFPMGFNMEPFQLGAFRSCKGIEKLEIPVSVTKLGKYTFKDSSIHTITLSPDCYYSSTTFTGDIVIEYWNVSNFTIINEPTKKEYIVGEEFDPSGLELRATITDNRKSITRNIIRNYTFDGFDSSRIGEYDVYVIFAGNRYLLPSKYVVSEQEV